VAVGSLLLVLGLIAVYTLIDIVAARRIIIALARASQLSRRMGCSLCCMLRVPRDYPFLAMEEVS
jgi:hypothetical protein